MAPLRARNRGPREKKKHRIRGCDGASARGKKNAEPRERRPVVKHVYTVQPAGRGCRAGASARLPAAGLLAQKARPRLPVRAHSSRRRAPRVS